MHVLFDFKYAASFKSFLELSIIRVKLVSSSQTPVFENKSS